MHIFKANKTQNCNENNLRGACPLAPHSRRAGAVPAPLVPAPLSYRRDNPIRYAPCLQRLANTVRNKSSGDKVQQGQSRWNVVARKRISTA